METIEKMPLLFSRDEVCTIALATQRFFEHLMAVRAGEEHNPEMDDDEIEDMLADGDTHVIDEAMLRNIAKRLKDIKEPRSVNLVYWSWEEFREAHTVVVLALSRSGEVVRDDRDSPSLEDAREFDKMFALAGRFDRIYDENKE
jgi:hypothetical protein